MANGQRKFGGGLPTAPSFWQSNWALPVAVSQAQQSAEARRLQKQQIAQQRLQYLKMNEGLTDAQIDAHPQLRKLRAIAVGVSPDMQAPSGALSQVMGKSMPPEISALGPYTGRQAQAFAPGTISSVLTGRYQKSEELLAAELAYKKARAGKLQAEAKSEGYNTAQELREQALKEANDIYTSEVSRISKLSPYRWNENLLNAKIAELEAERDANIEYFYNNLRANIPISKAKEEKAKKEEGKPKPKAKMQMTMKEVKKRIKQAGFKATDSNIKIFTENNNIEITE